MFSLSYHQNQQFCIHFQLNLDEYRTAIVSLLLEYMEERKSYVKADWLNIAHQKE